MASSKMTMADEINHLSEEVKYYRKEIVTLKLNVAELDYQLDIE